MGITNARPTLGPDDEHLSYVVNTPERVAILAQAEGVVRGQVITDLQYATCAIRLEDGLIEPQGTPSNLDVSYEHRNGTATARIRQETTFEVAEGADPVYALFEVAKKTVLKGMGEMPDIQLIRYDNRSSSHAANGETLSWHILELHVECNGEPVIACGEGQSLKQAFIHAMVRLAVHSKVLTLPQETQ